MKLVIGSLLCVLSTNAFATTHCAEVGQEEVQTRVEAKLKKLGTSVEVTTMIAEYDNPYDFIVLAGLGTAGAVAYEVKAHFENETVCVVDSVKPTRARLTKTLKQILAN